MPVQPTPPHVKFTQSPLLPTQTPKKPMCAHFVFAASNLCNQEAKPEIMSIAEDSRCIQSCSMPFQATKDVVTEDVPLLVPRVDL